MRRGIQIVGGALLASAMLVSPVVPAGVGASETIQVYSCLAGPCMEHNWLLQPDGTLEELEDGTVIGAWQGREAPPRLRFLLDDGLIYSGSGVGPDCYIGTVAGATPGVWSGCTGICAVPDADGDRVCDSEDICPGHDDDVDSDGDVVPDGCDVCPGGDDLVDTDGDLTPDGCDDGCDGFDGDGDGVCDWADVCELGDDAIDDDGDGFPAACDCNDLDDTVFPGAEEICGDGVDSDCDGDLDTMWYADRDRDGYGDPADALASCDPVPPANRVPDNTDCDDTDGEINPDAEERCNRLDDNCDGVVPVDEADADGDGQTPCEGDPDDDDPSVFLDVYMFSGIQNNVLETDLVGWDLCYNDRYGDFGASITGIAAACAGSHLMMACRQTGAAVLSTLAYAHRDDVMFPTGESDVLHVANDVGWYFDPNWSWGFANPVDPISRNSCDTETGAFPQHRLCWHTGSGGQLEGGWRCGPTTDLNSSLDWERLVYTADL